MEMFLSIFFHTASSLVVTKDDHTLVTKLCDSWNPMDCSLPGSSIYGNFQARVLEWVAIIFSRESSWPRNQTQASCIASTFFTNWAMRATLLMLD